MNDKIFIGVTFLLADEKKSEENQTRQTIENEEKLTYDIETFNIELCVLKDIELRTLLSGIIEGARKNHFFRNNDIVKKTIMGIYSENEDHKTETLKFSEFLLGGDIVTKDDFHDKEKDVTEDSGEYIDWYAKLEGKFYITNYLKCERSNVTESGNLYGVSVDMLNKKISDLGFLNSTIIYFFDNNASGIVNKLKQGEINEDGLEKIRSKILNYIENKGISLNTSNRAYNFQDKIGETSPTWIPEDNIKYPKYNISNRMIYNFEKASVVIEPPTPPASIRGRSLLYTIIPSILTAGLYFLIRYIFNNDSASFYSMGIITGIVAVLSGILFFGVNKIYNFVCTKEWKNNFFRYTNSLLKQGFDIWENYNSYLENQMDINIIGHREITIEDVDHLDKTIFSKLPGDEDFLNVYIGDTFNPDVPFEINCRCDIKSFDSWKFDINLDAQGNVKTTTGTEIDKSFHDMAKRRNSFISGKRISRNGSGKKIEEVIDNIYNRLLSSPIAIPQLYNIGGKRVVGIILKELNDILKKYNKLTYKQYEDSSEEKISTDEKGLLSDINDFSKNKWLNKKFIDSIILDLCYYHSSEYVQFILVFSEKSKRKIREEKIENYKYMPHFHGLFNNLSQFVFDSDSAKKVYNELTNILDNRDIHQNKNSDNSEEETKTDKQEKNNPMLPHIFVIIYDGKDYKLKEHELARYLPQNRQDNNGLGITFVYLSSFDEYLPSYCDDVIYISDLDNQDDEAEDKINIEIKPRETEISLIRPENRRYNTLDKRIYVRTIQQNINEIYKSIYGKLDNISCPSISSGSEVPSLVSLDDLWNLDGENLD